MVLHHTHVDAFRTRYNEIVYTVFRVFIGLLFMQHGAQKLFGIFTDSAVAGLFTQMWVAGIIEFFGGILIALGLFTVPVAVIATVEMIVAYFMAHAPQNLVPILNRGELALLYMAAFLFIAFEGPGRYSLDVRWCKGCRKAHR